MKKTKNLKVEIKHFQFLGAVQQKTIAALGMRIYKQN